MRLLLFIFITFVALTAVISGSLMIANPGGEMLELPKSILEDTPFDSFLYPGLILAVVVGGINFLAVIANMLHWPSRYNWSLAGGLILSGWIIIQMLLIATVHWLHILYLVTGIFIILLSYQLKGKWAA